MKERNPSQDTDERLEAWLAEAPLLPAKPGFSARVMRAIEARPPTWRQRLRRFWLEPRTLRWNAAGAVGSLLSLAVVVMLVIPLALPTGSTATADPVMVRFELQEPRAREVALAGDFSEWQASVRLRMQPDGTWVAEIPLAPGVYEYTFLVDGERWAVDPRARRYVEDGFGNRNAVMSVLPRKM